MSLNSASLIGLCERLFEGCDSSTDSSAIHLELLLSRTTGSDAGTETGERGTLTCETGQAVAELSELDLNFPLTGMSVLGKYVEDQRCPVHHPDFQSIFELGLLARAQVIIDDE